MKVRFISTISALLFSTSTFASTTIQVINDSANPVQVQAASGALNEGTFTCDKKEIEGGGRAQCKTVANSDHKVINAGLYLTQSIDGKPSISCSYDINQYDASTKTYFTAHGPNTTGTCRVDGNGNTSPRVTVNVEAE